MQEPTLDVTMRDAAQTVIHITYPDVDLFDELTAADAPSLASGDGASLRLNYALLAKIMSNNLDGITVTTTESAPAGYEFNVQILAEAIQCMPAGVVEDAWGVTFNGTTWIK
jgi:hypothetical protein